MGPAPYSPLGIAIFAVPLYAGPVLAGLSNAPDAVIPVFAGLFLLYMVLTRKPAATPGAQALQIALWAVVQSILAALCLGLGSVLSNITGTVPLPLWAPLALTALASAYGSYRYRHSAEMEEAVDAALMSLQSATPLPDDWNDPDPEILDWIDTYCRAPSSQSLSDTLTKLATHPDPTAVAETLTAQTNRSKSALELTLTHVTRPETEIARLLPEDIDHIFDEVFNYADPHLAQLALTLDKRAPGQLSEQGRASLRALASTDQP